MSEQQQQRDFSELASHLEFFGYENEDLKDEPGFRARHAGYGSIFVRPIGHHVLHSNYWMVSDNATDDDAEFLKIVNHLNWTSYVSTFSVMQDGSLRIDAVFCGEYSRQTYGEFIDDYHQDIVRAIRSNEELRAYRDASHPEIVN